MKQTFGELIGTLQFHSEPYTPQVLRRHGYISTELDYKSTIFIKTANIVSFNILCYVMYENF